jgi:hypothetical protein
MRVQTVIDALKDEDPNSEIMIQWFTKEDVESNTRAEYTEEQWNLAVRLFEKWDVSMDDFGVPTALAEAHERLAAAE